MMSKTAGRSSITNSPFCGVLVCACAADAAQLARMMSAARRVPLIVILILSGSPNQHALTAPNRFMQFAHAKIALSGHRSPVAPFGDV
jgi:hypothetical protein